MSKSELAFFFISEGMISRMLFTVTRFFFDSQRLMSVFFFFLMTWQIVDFRLAVCEWYAYKATTP